MSRKRVLPKICIALGLPDVKGLLEEARREASAGESFLEFRLDYLDRPMAGAEAIAAFLAEFPECTVLATCRRQGNHGKFAGTTQEQLSILGTATANGAQLFDVEIETAEAAAAEVAALRAGAMLCLSYHNYESTPQMDRVVKRMRAVPADIYKVVTTARKLSDAGRVLASSKVDARMPAVFLAMGEQGLATRVLAPAFGSLFTYAAPGNGSPTAPGQVTAQELRHLYRADRLTRAVKIYGVIADPVRHSISPAVHNRAFQAKRLDAVYLPFLVTSKLLPDFFVFAERMGVAGFSVTIPHKRAVARMMDQVDPLAKRIGAVNTVYKKAGKWRGANTDVAGILTPLQKHLRLPKAEVLIVGYGGAARGAAVALRDARCRIFITGRDMARARLLANFCDGEALTAEQALARKFQVLVHATPLGMFPHPEESFFENEIPADIVFDMVYNPRETRLLKLAREQGKITIPGIEMFIEQAVKQFELWTGEAAPRAVMEKAASDALSQTP
jgi:3-dehydroquinate dehydratase/shikimate dehydrogenase